MKKVLSFREKNEEGFTLIELLVVILIIGILSAIAIPAFTKQRKTSIDTTVKSDIVNAAKQVASWDIGNGGQTKPFPTTTTGTALEKVLVSSGNSISLRGNSADYCISGINPSGSDSVTGISYSSKNGGLSEEFNCDSSFVPSQNPSMNTEIKFGEAENASPANPSEESEKPVANPPAVCDDVVFTSSAGTTIACAPGTSNWAQDIFIVTVKSDSDTPVEWNVNINAGRSKGYKKADLDSSTAFDNYAVTTPVFTIKGTDRSGNGRPDEATNYKFIDKSKTMTFTVRVTWR